MATPQIVTWYRVRNEETEFWEFVYCCFFTAKAGVVISSFQGLTSCLEKLHGEFLRTKTIMIVTALVNIYAENDESRTTQVVQYMLLFIYLIAMSTGYVAGLISAYMEKSVCVRAGAFLLGLGIGLFIIFTIISFMPNEGLRDAVCIEGRCSDFHWLVNISWRDSVYKERPPERRVTNFSSNSTLDFDLEEMYQYPENETQPNKDGSTGESDNLIPHTIRTNNKLTNSEDNGDDNFPYVLVSLLHLLFIIAWMLYTLVTYLGYTKHLTRYGR